ncbi:Gfo/Idh/MocA family protein [Mycobacterium deserti]|uniref:Gfo/Idh/MocA family oxidoreductase n=1 Tax=Mycobacterium deserti TaxID=2978347 RepID=A0ABT2MEV2_9MYCO|nr:Gfo/Idh/MocA family oxidoreductase [Mycobacterium deserti]MCT7660476.1 Gfo/Idh/MocA family oxidoreductase [Mycobacterium deserti]
MTDRRLKAGMVGGGPGAMIGTAHRHAMWLDNQYALTAGVFSRDEATSRDFADTLGVERSYADYRQMAEQAHELDLVAVVTPNDSHFEIAAAFLEKGVAVVCEKPLTNDSASAAELVALAEANGTFLAVPHIYSAYAMVRHAARMVRDGELGRVRFVAAEHASGWASAPVDQWRMDPAKGGVATAVADVGTHAYHLLRYITGMEATRISAELSILVEGRPVFDNATVRLTMSNGAPATVWATMAATGQEHGLRIRVFGDDASIQWHHEDPQHLTVRHPDGGVTILAHGMSTLSDDAARLTRVGLGHPEGFLEAFANFYTDLSEILRTGRQRELSIPTGVDGLRGVQFVEATIASHGADAAWVALPQ